MYRHFLTVNFVSFCNDAIALTRNRVWFGQPDLLWSGSLRLPSRSLAGLKLMIVQTPSISVVTAAHDAYMQLIVSKPVAENTVQAKCCWAEIPLLRMPWRTCCACGIFLPFSHCLHAAQRSTMSFAALRLSDGFLFYCGVRNSDLLMNAVTNFLFFFHSL